MALGSTHISKRVADFSLARVCFVPQLRRLVRHGENGGKCQRPCARASGARARTHSHAHTGQQTHGVGQAYRTHPVAQCARAVGWPSGGIRDLGVLGGRDAETVFRCSRALVSPRRCQLHLRQPALTRKRMHRRRWRESCHERHERHPPRP